MREFRREGRNDFRRDDRSGGSRFGPRDRGFAKGPPRMFDATCSQCGKQCQVPFRPTGSKPVLCSECFRPNDRAPRGDFRSERRPFRNENQSFSPQQSSPGVSSEQIAQINAKLDTILRVLKDLEIIPGEDEVEGEEIADDSDDESEEN